MTAAADAPYTLRGLEQALGLSRSVVSGLVKAGYVVPARGPRNEWRFTFQDAVLLRTAYHLQAANIPTRRLLRALRQLKAKLPPELPLAGLRIKAVGNEVAVIEGDARDAQQAWEAASGQLLMDFEVEPSSRAGGSVTFLERTPRPRADAEPTAADWFARGESLDAVDRTAAEAAYRQALALAPDHVYAAVNLGALLCDAGRCREAVRLYEQSVSLQPDEPLLHFNAAIALEDLQDDTRALAAYERCLALDPGLADAHYNAARLYDRIGDSKGALRHFSAFRRLERAASAEPAVAESTER